MSSPAALATVTATLQHLLSGVATGGSVTAKPPAVARDSGSGGQLNIFLYSVQHDPALRNGVLPGMSRNSASSFPPLPLQLKYLLTAYGVDDDDLSAQELLGQAMRLLHDHPVLSRMDIQGIFPDSGLEKQIEHLRITPDPLSLDDMTKLWNSFQTGYRLSAGYEVSVVLIESDRAGRIPLPVLKRGDQDQGVRSQASASPVLSALVCPDRKSSAELGDLLVILGDNLSTNNCTVRLQHQLLAAPIELQPEPGGTSTRMRVRIPDKNDDPQVGDHWPAGFYTLSLVVTSPGAVRWATNALPFSLAPRIQRTSPATLPAGTVPVTVECLPRIQAGQRVLLLFGDRAVAPQGVATPADPTKPSTLTFSIDNVVARPEPYVLRLRVDGVDSIPVDFSGPVPFFADTQKVTIT